MMVSVVCPFYNEELVIENSVRLMLKNLSVLKEEWELIIVNDGSKDRSHERAKSLEAESSRLTVLGYEPNRGAGHAIIHGAMQARGDILITAEIDSSWGDEIIGQIVDAFHKNPQADIINASPHLPGGGYRNVPAFRVFLSAFGNHVIQTGLSFSVTMNTGMTRGYRRDKFLALPLDENGKEQQPEIINKALGLGYKIVEIPAVLEWRDSSLSVDPKRKRQSSSRMMTLVRTHVLFSLLSAPYRYLYSLAAVLLLSSAGCLVLTCMRLCQTCVPWHTPGLAFAMTGLAGILVFCLALLAQQNRMIQQDVWRMRSEWKIRPR